MALKSVEEMKADTALLARLIQAFEEGAAEEKAAAAARVDVHVRQCCLVLDPSTKQ